MTPVLFPADATTFTTQGLGALSDAISCTVKEERNGIFELTMEYPAGGLHFSAIANRCIIWAIPSPYRTAQPFRIYRITSPLGGVVTIYARHVSYDLDGVPLNPFSASNAPAAMAGLKSNAAVSSPFTFWTDKTTAAAFSVDEPTATRSKLGGSSGSILDAYGGEYAWDGFTVRLYNKRGADNGVSIRYGKNLTDIEQDANIASVCTGIYPFWKSSDGTLVVCDPKVVNVSGTFDFVRVVPVDFSGDFENAPTAAQLQAKAESYIKANNVGVPTVSITASFVQLEQTEEYKDIAVLERCDLCDTVTVQFERLGIDVKAEIVSVETDVLLERYNKIEVGSIRTNIASTIVQGQQQATTEAVATARSVVSNATNWLTNSNGYVIAVKDSNGAWKETLYLDRPDAETAVNVLRINTNGIGFSTSGINGPYRNAWTIDGNLVADFITSGTLNAALVTIENLIVSQLSSTKDDYNVTIDAGAIELNGKGNRCGFLGTVFSDFDEKDYSGYLMLNDENNLRSILSKHELYVGEKGYGGERIGIIYAGTGYFAKSVHAGSFTTEELEVNKMGVGGGAVQTVEWVWDGSLGRYVLCTVT